MNSSTMNSPTRWTAWRGLVLVALLALFCSACATSDSARNSAQSSRDMTPYDDDVFALSARADRAYRESRLIDAARDYQRLAERVPGDAYAWFRLGNIHAQQGSYDRAIHAYETSLRNDDEQVKPWFNLSTSYLLKARVSMLRAHSRMRADDPGREMITERLSALDQLIHGRFEDGSDPAVPVRR